MLFLMPNILFIIFHCGFVYGAMRRGQPAQRIERGQHSAFPVSEYIVEAIHPRDTKTIHLLSNYVVDYCHSIGMVALWKDEPNDLAVVWSTGLLPSPFPEELYNQAMDVQPFVNELYYRVTLDHEFLLNAFKHMAEMNPLNGKRVNEWIGRQVDLMERVKKEGIRQKKTLIFNRTDYMTHQINRGDEISLKQVEVNISQLGGPGNGQGMSKLHQQMIDKIKLLHYGKQLAMDEGKRPESKSATQIAEGMLLAWESFSKEFEDPKAVIVFLFDAQVITVSYFDQVQFMQFELEHLALERGHYANVVLVTIPESPKRIHLDEEDGHLYVDGDKRVGLVHMVVGLLPHHWKTDREWESRFQMERSNAIISPNIRAQLAGTKRIQQLLAMPNALERFFDPVEEKHKIDALEATFVQLWGLENADADTEKIVQEAIREPDNFVLKAQLGGGKGNFFGAEIAKMLDEMSPQQRSAFTLMEKIHPIAVKNYMRRPFHPVATLHDVNSELSIFGTYLGKGEFDAKTIEPNRSQKEEEIFNRVEGYYVRSKLASSDQGGMSTGHGFQDSLLLFKEIKFR